MANGPVQPTVSAEDVTNQEQPTLTAEDVTNREQPTLAAEDVTNPEQPTLAAEDVTNQEQPTLAAEEVTNEETVEPSSEFFSGPIPPPKMLMIDEIQKPCAADRFWTLDESIYKGTVKVV